MYPESNRNFESNRILGGVGALLTAIGSLVIFSGPVGIVGLVGIVLLLISMRSLADDFKEPTIFRSAVTGFIFGIIGVAIAIAVFAAFAFFTGFIFAGHPIIGGFGILVAIVSWIVMFVFFILETIFLKHSFDVLAFKSREGILRTGGTILLIGGFLTIIFVGFFLMFIAWILIAVGLFSLRSPTQTAQTWIPPTATPTLTTSPSGQTKYCPFCGAENKLEGTFCTRCGRRLNPV